MAEEDEFGLDDDLGDLQDDADTGSIKGLAGVSGSSSRRRNLIIVSVVLGVVLVGSLLFGMKIFSKNESPIRRGGPISAEQIRVEEKKEKRKKKKINYEKLYNQLTGIEISKVLKEFSFAGLTFKTEQNGSNFVLFVDEDDAIEARNLLAMKGLPSGQARGYELLDESQTLGVTEFDKRIRFLRALSGELEKAIMQFVPVDDAKVQIVLPEQRLFSVIQPPVTSSILIRRGVGVTISDDLVFSIIMLVSQAVENLQPENVSVIDTEGMVLSLGIFERLAQKKAGTFKEKKVPPTAILATTKEEAFGQPVIPNFDAIREWFDLKWEFEQKLVYRSTKHLMGILPLGAYKVSVTSDLGPLEGGRVVDIRRLTIGVVVDNNNDDIFLDSQTKQQIYATVAGATGYVKGRDQIVLSRADFSLLTPEDKEQLEKFRDEESRKQFLQKLWSIGGPIAFIGLSLLGLISYIKKRRLDKIAAKKMVLDTVDKGSVEDEHKDVDASRYIGQVKAVADTEPELVAKLMEDWLSSPVNSLEAVPIDTLTDDVGEDVFDDLNFDDDFEDDIAEDTTL